MSNHASTQCFSIRYHAHVKIYAEDAMTTLAVIVLAVASVAGLGQLLDDENKTTFRRTIPTNMQAGDRQIQAVSVAFK